jgi:hypothetical protein
MIKAVPFNVFNYVDTNKQKIIKIDYPRYTIGTIVLKRPTKKPSGETSELPIKVFNFDPRPYIIIGTEDRKYLLRES